MNKSLAAHANDLPSCIVYPEDEEGNSFEIRHHMLEILPIFQGLSHEDLNMHITDFFLWDARTFWLMDFQPNQSTSSFSLNSKGKGEDMVFHTSIWQHYFLGAVE